MAEPTRWVTDTDEGHSQWYIDRFRTMAAEGVDLAGEARLLDAMIDRGSRVLDAGCGPGRVGAELHARGHVVVGVDADPALIAAAQEDHPGPRWLVADDLRSGKLVELKLEAYAPVRAPLFAMHASDRSPGPAASWLIERFRRVLNCFNEAAPDELVTDEIRALHGSDLERKLEAG